MPARVRAENQPDGLDPHVGECRRTLPNSLSTHEAKALASGARRFVPEKSPANDWRDTGAADLGGSASLTRPEAAGFRQPATGGGPEALAT